MSEIALEHILVLRVDELPASCGPDDLLKVILTPAIAAPPPAGEGLA